MHRACEPTEIFSVNSWAATENDSVARSNPQNVVAVQVTIDHDALERPAVRRSPGAPRYAHALLASGRA